MYYIIGSGGLAKEVLFLTKEVFGDYSSFGGFIDYQPKGDSINCMLQQFPVWDETKFLSEIKPSDEVILYIGIGDPKAIEKVVDKFQDYQFPNLIHPNVILDDSVILGRGNIVTAGCIFTVDIKIGSHNYFNLNSTYGHDIIIGDMNIFNPGLNMSGGIEIANCCLIGTGSTVLQYVNIGSEVVVGAGSMVNKDIEQGTTVVGIPAKPLNR